MLRAILLLMLTGTAAVRAEDPAPTAGAGEHAVLAFRITNAVGELIPARLTFETEGERPRPLFRNTQAAPRDLAVRENVVYSRTGQGVITVPVGVYEITASRGPEYALQTFNRTLKAGERTELTWKLERQVDTNGWVAGDFHLHTLTHSGHGDANMNERMISLAGECVEFAVATDHNHNIDYNPTLRELELQHTMRAVVGNEVSTPIGHFNAFPLDPSRDVPPADATDAVALFRMIRAETNEFGVVPVIQLNHPRWGGIDYFGHVGLDPITGVAGKGYSPDFDTIELLNENEGWGYHDAERAGDLEVGSSRYSVLQDWYNLLNRGHRAAVVGNSDSHTVQVNIAGYPRNYVRSSTDTPAEIDPAEIAASLRSHQVFTTTGPFVTYEVRRTARKRINLVVTVQSADWIKPDRVQVIINGDVVQRDRLPDRPHVTWRRSLDLPAGDCWMTIIVEGSEPLPSRAVPDTKRPILPLAICNPTWFDVDQDDAWTSPYDQARQRVAAFTHDLELLATICCDLPPTELGLLAYAAGEAGSHAAATVIGKALHAPTRVTRLWAARAAEVHGDPALRDDLEARVAAAEDDYERVTLLRALGKVGNDPQLVLSAASPAILKRYGADLLRDVPATIVRAWQVVGYFPNPSRGTLVGMTYGPETSRPQDGFVGKGDQPVGWQPHRADESGYFDFKTLPGEPDNAIVYARVWLQRDVAGKVPFALGTDDGARMWLNGALIHEDTGRHGASPFQHAGSLDLRAGWNLVVLKVENGTGGFGAYLRVFDDAVTVSAEQP